MKKLSDLSGDMTQQEKEAEHRKKRKAELARDYVLLDKPRRFLCMNGESRTYSNLNYRYGSDMIRECLQDGSLKVVYGSDYSPTSGRTFRFEDGFNTSFKIPASKGDFLNIYKPSRVKPEPADMYERAKNSKTALSFDLLTNFMSTKAIEVELLTSWCAFAVQNIGTRIPFAPMLFAPLDSGKRLITKLLADVLDGTNVSRSSVTIGPRYIECETRRLIISEDDVNNIKAFKSRRDLIEEDVVERGTGSRLKRHKNHASYFFNSCQENLMQPACQEPKLMVIKSQAEYRSDKDGCMIAPERGMILTTRKIQDYYIHFYRHHTDFINPQELCTYLAHRPIHPLFTEIMEKRLKPLTPSSVGITGGKLESLNSFYETKIDFNEPAMSLEEISSQTTVLRAEWMRKRASKTWGRCTANQIVSASMDFLRN